MRFSLLPLLGLWLLGSCARPLSSPPATAAAPATAVAAATFANPLLPSGADPWTIYHAGYYYYTHTTGGNLTLWKTKSLAELKTAEKKAVWTPPATGPNSREIWAPELHFLQGKWYIYYSADAGTNQTHRVWVLENSSPDPLQGTWIDRENWPTLPVTAGPATGRCLRTKASCTSFGRAGRATPTAARAST